MAMAKSLWQLNRLAGVHAGGGFVDVQVDVLGDVLERGIAHGEVAAVWMLAATYCGVITSVGVAVGVAVNVGVKVSVTV